MTNIEAFLLGVGLTLVGLVATAAALFRYWDARHQQTPGYQERVAP